MDFLDTDGLESVIDARGKTNDRGCENIHVHARTGRQEGLHGASYGPGDRDGTGVHTDSLKVGHSGGSFGFLTHSNHPVEQKSGGGFRGSNERSYSECTNDFG